MNSFSKSTIAAAMLSGIWFDNTNPGWGLMLMTKPAATPGDVIITGGMFLSNNSDQRLWATLEPIVVSAESTASLAFILGTIDGSGFPAKPGHIHVAAGSMVLTPVGDALEVSFSMPTSMVNPLTVSPPPPLGHQTSHKATLTKLF